MSTSLGTARKTELDALRVLACLMVIAIHVCFSGWHKASPASTTWQFTNFCNSLTRGSVCVFVLISGANLLREEKPLPLLYKKYILRLFLSYAVWALFYAADEVGLHGLTSLSGIKSLIYNCFDAKYHLWFLASMVGAYMALPLLWCVVRWEDGKYVKYLCLAFLGLSGLLSLVSVLPLPHVILNALQQFFLPIGYFPGTMLVGYFLSGDFLKRVRIWQLWAVFFAAVLLTTACNGFLSYRAGEAKDILLGNFSITSLTEACCLFCLFRKAAANPIFTKYPLFWKRLSVCTLGIFLLHVFVLEHFELWLGVTIFSLPVPLSIPLLTVGIFIVCLAATALLRRIPFVGKWLV